MNETKSISRTAVTYEDGFPNCCPLCGRIITTMYPEIAPGIRYARCQYGHKIRLEKEDYPQKTAG